jgi:hypothetical protein
VTGQLKKHLCISIGAYSALCFCALLRGKEGFLLDLNGLHLYIQEGKEPQVSRPHVIAPLLGRFKNDIGKGITLY